MYPLDGTVREPVDFKTALNLLATADREDMVYRGQGRATWPLCPSLYRDGNGKPLERSERRWRLNRLSSCVADFMTEYNRLFGSEPKVAQFGYPERVALAQHHGVPTPLIDWTDSLMVALFMASAYWDKSDPTIRVYGIPKEEFNSENRAVLFDSLRVDPRQDSQHGYLSYCVSDKSSQWSPNYMDELVDGQRFFLGEIRYVDLTLDESEHERVMEFLDRNRISFKTLFPDSLQWFVLQLKRKHFGT